MHGFVFEGCTLAALEPGFTGALLARDFGAQFPNGEVVFLNTTIRGEILASSPWSFAKGTDPSKLNFCEYGSLDPSGNLIAITDAQRRDRQCTEEIAAQFASPAFVLEGWSPTVPPLDSVLSWVQAPTRAARTSPSFQPAVRRVSAGGGRVLEVSGAGPVQVRRILPDGSSEVLFRCAAPCREGIKPGTTPAWLEVNRAGSRTIVPVPFRK